MTIAEGTVVRYHGTLGVVSSAPFTASTPATLERWGPDEYVRLTLQRGFMPAKTAELEVVPAAEVASLLWRVIGPHAGRVAR